MESKRIRCKAITDNISSFLKSSSVVIIMLIGAVMVANGSISAGSVAAMMGYFSVFDSIIKDISFIIRKIPIIKNVSERMIVLYSDIEDLTGKEIYESSNIEADNLSYAYTDKPVFSNINFNIPAGSKTAICGENGSGKSTLINIISGLIKGYSGSLKINGVELKEAAIGTWRNMFAYAMQDLYLFEGTVKENIHLGRLTASEEEVKAVMHYVGIDHLASRTVSMDMNDLSGGEKQKISVARALLKNTPILILDEPSNNLDSDSMERGCFKTPLVCYYPYSFTISRIAFITASKATPTSANTASHIVANPAAPKMRTANLITSASAIF